MENNGVLIEQQKPMGANSSLWSRNPVLGALPGRNYYGRIFVEVWEKDARLVSDSREPSWLQGAMIALKTNTYRKVGLNLTDEPTTGQIANQAYHGCVVIEQWDDQVLVGLTGSSQLLERAIQILEGI